MKATILTLSLLGTMYAYAQGPATSSSDGMTGNPNYQTPNSTPSYPNNSQREALDPNAINRNNPRPQRTTPGLNSETRRSQNTTTSDSYNGTAQPGRQESEGSSNQR